MTRLAIVSTHPIQYNAPLFRHLAQASGLDLKVFYGWEGTARQADPEFGHEIAWDLPLLDGYEWDIVPNTSTDPGTHHFNGLRNPEMIPRLHAWGPDVVLVYGWAWQSHFSVMRHFKGRRPVFLRGDSTLASFSGAAWKRWLRRPALQWVYRHVDLALSPGQRNREYLHAVGVEDTAIANVPHAVEVDRFAAPGLQEAADAGRQALGIPSEAVVFGFAGKFVPRKQCSVLIEAFQRLAAADGPRPHLVLVGEGPLRGALEAQAGGDPNVNFLGFRNQSEMPVAYRLADVFVLPSSIESWGLGVNEALASGRPAIVSDRVGAAPDLVAGRRYGKVVSCGNATALTSAMEDFCGPRAQVLALGEEARRDAAGFSIAAAAERLLEQVFTWSAKASPA